MIWTIIPTSFVFQAITVFTGLPYELAVGAIAHLFPYYPFESYAQIDPTDFVDQKSVVLCLINNIHVHTSTMNLLCISFLMASHDAANFATLLSRRLKLLRLCALKLAMHCRGSRYSSKMCILLRSVT